MKVSIFDFIQAIDKYLKRHIDSNSSYITVHYIAVVVNKFYFSEEEMSKKRSLFSIVFVQQLANIYLVSMTLLLLENFFLLIVVVISGIINRSSYILF